MAREMERGREGGKVEGGRGREGEREGEREKGKELLLFSVVGTYWSTGHGECQPSLNVL